MRILVSWIGGTDLKAGEGARGVGLGPVAQALAAREFDHVHLLCNYEQAKAGRYVRWLREDDSSPPIKLAMKPLSSPINFGEIYRAVVDEVEWLLEKYGRDTRLVFHLSPGTPAMQAVWIIVAKTRYAAELLESSQEGGVATAIVPFDIAAEFIPEVQRRPDEQLARISAGIAESAPEFDDIVHRSPGMERAVAMARRAATRSIPVLLEGESGTGKEMFAGAIHRSSPRKDEPIVVVNCGAIPPELAESELFGHKKGAFTGATTDRAGHFEKADGGTIFLDEIGELPQEQQVKLLRVLQEGAVTRIGDSKAKSIDVRVLAATNRHLPSEIAEGRFREDLFYRLAVAVITLPPLRRREGDLSLLIKHLLAEVNEESAAELAWEPKKLSSGAKRALLNHHWPGNVRELKNTLTRAAIWSRSGTITEAEAKDALLVMPAAGEAGDGILNRSLEAGIDLQELMGKVARHYLDRALEESEGNKTRAAELLGLGSYQTLTNWVEKYGG